MSRDRMSISMNSTFHGCLSFPPGCAWEKHDDTDTISARCSNSTLRGVLELTHEALGRADGHWVRHPPSFERPADHRRLANSLMAYHGDHVVGV